MDLLPFKISKLLGLFPYDSSPSEFKSPIFYYSAILTIFNTLGSWYVAARVLRFSINNFQLMEFLNVAMFQFFENLGYVGVTLNLIQIGRNKSFFREISGLKIRHTGIFKCFSYLTAFGLILTVIGEVFCVKYEPTINLIMWFFTHGIYRFMYLLICVQYCTFMVLIAKQLEVLTTSIKTEFVRWGSIFSARDHLNAILFKLHSIYTYQLFLMSVDVFFNLVFLTYFFYFYVLVGGKEFGPTAQSLLVIVISAVTMLLPSMTISYVKKTVSIVHSIVQLFVRLLECSFIHSFCHSCIHLIVHSSFSHLLFIYLNQYT